MQKQIIVITLFDSFTNTIILAKAFSKENEKKADEFFINTLKERYEDDVMDWSDEDFNNTLMDGICEPNSTDVLTKVLVDYEG